MQPTYDPTEARELGYYPLTYPYLEIEWIWRERAEAQLGRFIPYILVRETVQGITGVSIWRKKQRASL